MIFTNKEIIFDKTYNGFESFFDFGRDMSEIFTFDEGVLDFGIVEAKNKKEAIKKSC